MDSWALDLGTTNTGLARWDQAGGQAHLQTRRMLVDRQPVVRLL